jgi:uncharacterized protein involved in outer membrane biogenesis
MKVIKVLLAIGLVLVLLGVAAAGVGVWYLNNFVQSPEFKKQLVATASKATGTAVDIQSLHVSLWRGIELRGVKIGNPSGFAGDLLTAQAFTVRYRLWALFQKRLEVATLTLDTPDITLAKNAQGDWNYDKLGAKSESAATKTDSGGATSVGGLDVTLQNVALKNASIVMLKDEGQLLLRLGDVNLTTAVEWTGGKPTGAGQAKIAVINCADSLFVRNVAAPVQITAAAVKLAPLTGAVADGAVTGDAALSLAGDSRYTVNLQVKDAAVTTLLKEAGVAKAVFTSGKLQLTTALTGTGGLETIGGTGKAEVTGGQLVEIPILNLLATLLQTSALRNLAFDEFVLEYVITNNVMQTPVIRVVSPQVQITGKGKITLDDYKLDHALTLVFSAATMDKVPKEIRNVFTKRDDGSFAIDFNVTGPYDAPKTDLQQKLISGAAGSLLQKFLK